MGTFGIIPPWLFSFMGCPKLNYFCIICFDCPHTSCVYVFGFKLKRGPDMETNFNGSHYFHLSKFRQHWWKTGKENKYFILNSRNWESTGHAVWSWGRFIMFFYVGDTISRNNQNKRLWRNYSSSFCIYYAAVFFCTLESIQHWILQTRKS